MSAASLPPPELSTAPQDAPAKRRVSLARLRRALELLDSHSTFLITSHIGPDGDAIGSALALRHLLVNRGKQTQVVLQDPVPAEYVGLPGADQITQAPPDAPAEVAIVVDCENLGRVGTLGPAVERCGDLLVLDHHLSSGRFGRLELRETAAAACAELLYRLVRLADGLTPDIAECLMAGLVLDTGGFRFPNVTPATLRVAAKLVETGAQIPRLYQSIYENRSFSATKLLGLALASTRSVLEGNVIYAVLTRRDFEEAGALQNETDGIVNYLLSIRGASVALLFREAPDGGIRVSLRSRGASDMNRVAKAFGGGGHQQASGCTVAGPLDSAVAQVLAEVGKQAPCWSSRV